jgi:hypothetical protein
LKVFMTSSNLGPCKGLVAYQRCHKGRYLTLIDRRSVPCLIRLQSLGHVLSMSGLHAAMGKHLNINEAQLSNSAEYTNHGDRSKP